MRALVADMRAEWRELDRRIGAFDDEFAARARSDEAARRLATIPGIGVLNATALAGRDRQGEAFGRGRDLAAWLGLVPRQVTTGGRAKLLGISKRGNKYLRKLLIHGARAVLRLAVRERDAARGVAAGPPGTGAQEHGRGRLANKLARIAWAVLRRTGGTFNAGAADGGLSEIGRPRRARRESADDVCGWWKRDGLTVEPAFRKPGFKNGALDAVAFMRTGTRGSPSWPGACSEADGVDGPRRHHRAKATAVDAVTRRPSNAD